MTYGLPHLADATDLDHWADTRSAQADLPRLVRRLICAENDQVQRVEMRGGEGVGLTGYDGFVEAGRATSFVPEGESVWEMGVGGTPATKAQSDYRSRTDDPRGIDPSEHTFVFVTPRRWEDKKDWEQRKLAEGVWRDVRVLDADDLEQALDVSPAVQVWLSELLGLEPLGATSVEDWWRRYSRGFDPGLVPAVVLAGRADQASVLVRRMANDVGRTYIRAVTVDDGLAFAACSMMAVSPEDAEAILARSLLVHDGLTLRRLDRTSSLLILLPYEEGLQREAQLVENHHVVFVVTDPAGDVDIELPPHDHLALRESLVEAGAPADSLDRYVRAGTKSLEALRRVAARFSQRDPDAWINDLAQRAVRRAWLLGGWNQLRSGDNEVLIALCESEPESLDELLQDAVRRPDPLFTKVGATWAVASPQDSWRTARGLITGSDLDGLEQAVQTVLGAIDPRLDLPVDERWAAALEGKAPVHSSNLRKGLARTVALLGTRGDDVRLAAGRSAREWAERVTLSLFTRANEDKSAQLWTSIADILPLLAEAAPDAFLRAVAESTRGEDPLAKRLFQDVNSGWNVSSPHSGLLWAIEVVAWSERYMAYAAETLAALAEIDPGGRLSNRPSGSLLAIFRAWSPQTAASLDARSQTLDSIARRHPRAAWELLLSLYPSGSDFGMQSQVPEFRDWATRATPAAHDDLLATLEAAGPLLLELAKADPSRWKEVIAKFDLLPAGLRKDVINEISTIHTLRIDARVSHELWDAILNYVRHHREYADADWSLSEDWLGQLLGVAQTLAPDKPADVNRWLFEDWHPDIGVGVDDLRAYDAALGERRDDAIRGVLVDEGLDGVRRLALSVKLPWAVGSALAATADAGDVEVISDLDSDDRAAVQFAEGFARRRLEGSIDEIHRWVDRFDGRPLLQSRLLQLADDVANVWAALEDYDVAVRDAYWKEFSPYGRGADFPYIGRAVAELLAHGRAAIAVDALSLYASHHEAEIEEDLVVRALQEFGTHDDPEAASVSAHDISRLLTFLRDRGVDEARIALLEWRYLPLLQERAEMPALQRLLANDPSVFVDLIGMVFKPASAANEERPDASQQDPALASNAFRLLRGWKVVPGTNEHGVVESGPLSTWIRTARQLLAANDRSDIGELQIGEVLAHAPEDSDGTFPTLAVRDALESAPNERLVRGFAVGVYNKRGVTSRSMTDGGRQEYDLASKFAAWAEAVQASHPRTAAVLRDIEESYREDGRRNDEEARRFLEGMDF